MLRNPEDFLPRNCFSLLFYVVLGGRGQTRKLSLTHTKYRRNPEIGDNDANKREREMETEASSIPGMYRSE